MATESKITAQGKGGAGSGFVYKTTEIFLGIASAVSLVMSFVPGLNFLGAAIQAATTVVQTGMDLVTKGFKKAMLTLVSGTLLTGLSFIPFLRAAGKTKAIAEEGILGAAGATKVAAVGADATAVGIADAATVAKPAGTLSKAWGKVTSFFGAAKTKTGNGITYVAKNTVGRVPGVNQGVGWLKVQDAAMADKFTNHNLIGKAADWVENNPKKSGALQAVAMVGGMGIGALAGGDTPPTSLLNPKTYDYSTAPAAQATRPQGQWSQRIQAERAASAEQLAINGPENPR